MADKQQLHQLVERLPEEQVDTMHRILLALSGDPVLYSLLTAPEDDESETEEERRAVAEARASIRRGEPGKSLEEISREYGL